MKTQERHLSILPMKKRVTKNLCGSIQKSEESQPLESYPGEYLAYLRAYVDDIIFANDVLDKEISEVKDTKSAADFGIQRELNSILCYHELKNSAPENHHNLIEKVIDEERKHFSKLTELRRKG